MSSVCPICQKNFSSKPNRDRHVASIHEKSGHFKCGNCGKRFFDESNLKRHERMHTGEKPFACKVCQRRFAHKHDLEIHHLGIHGEKKFKCQTCGMGFGRKQALQEHLVVHSEEKPFQCELCPKRFRSKPLLRSHRRCHLDDKPFRCDLCEFSSKYKSSLRAHQKRLHSTNRRGTSGKRGLARGDDQRELPVRAEQTVGSDGSSGTKYNLRMRSKTTNYRSGPDGVEPERNTGRSSTGYSVNASDHQSSDEPNGPDEESGREDEPVVHEEAQNGGDDYPECGRPTQRNESRPTKEYEMITLSSDEDDEDAELPPESSTMTSTNLTVVYGVEYIAPDDSE